MGAAWTLPHCQEIDFAASLMLNMSRLAFYKENVDSHQTD
jgi:hypothetical protein